MWNDLRNIMTVISQAGMLYLAIHVNFSFFFFFLFKKKLNAPKSQKAPRWEL